MVHDSSSRRSGDRQLMFAFEPTGLCAAERSTATYDLRLHVFSSYWGYPASSPAGSHTIRSSPKTSFAMHLQSESHIWAGIPVEIDIPDGFYRIAVRTEDASKLDVLFPTRDGEPPLVLPMGRCESPPSFCVATKKNMR